MVEARAPHAEHPNPYPGPRPRAGGGRSKARAGRWSALVLGLMSAHQTHAAPPARPVIEVHSPTFRPYALAIAPANTPAGGAKAGRSAVRTLRKIFTIHMGFRVLDPKSYLANPATEGMRAASIRFEDWINVGAQGLIKCRVRKDRNGLGYDFSFFDVATGRSILSKSYQGGREQAGDFARAFGDLVVEKLTGLPGIFQTEIAVILKRKKSRDVIRMNIDGSSPRVVAKNGSVHLLPAWFRDGGGLLYTSFATGRPLLYAHRFGKKPRVISRQPGLNTGGQMSPDGATIALTLTRDENAELYLLRKKRLVRLTREWGIDSQASWSPDGKEIAFVSDRWGSPQIFIMNKDGSGVRRLTTRGNYNQTPDWAPRGDLIAFTARDERNVFDIFTVHAKTKAIHRLTQDQGHNEEPSFSPDGQHVVFTSTRNGGSSVWIMAYDGSNQVRITSDGHFLTPVWSPQRVAP